MTNTSLCVPGVYNRHSLFCWYLSNTRHFQLVMAIWWSRISLAVCQLYL